MKTFFTLVGSLLLFALSSGIFAFAMVKTMNLEMLGGSRNLFLAIAFVVFFASLAIAFSASKRMYPTRFVAAAVICVFAYGGYYVAINKATNVTLSTFFKSGTSCSFILNLIPITEAQNIATITENTCYLSIMHNEAKLKVFEEKMPYIFSAAEIFKRVNRFDPTTLALLAANTTMAHMEHKKTFTTDEERADSDVTMVGDHITLLEMLDQHPENQGEVDMHAPEKLMGQITERLSKTVVTKILLATRKLLQKCSLQFPVRIPASIQPLSHQEKIAGIVKRWEALQVQWQITDDDLIKADKVIAK